jgi:hypothetical protein
MIKIKNPMVLQPFIHPHMPKGANAMSQKKKEQYVPYNKSILTRIIAPMLSKNNIIILHHLTRRSVLTHLEKGTSSSLFLFLDKIYGERRLLKKKINEQEALKLLQKRFGEDLKDIY